MDIIIGAAIALALGLITNEIYDTSGWLARKIVARAAKRLPVEMQQRYREEWLAYLEECPGKLSRLVAAIGIAFSAGRVGSAVRAPVSASSTPAKKDFVMVAARLIVRADVFMKDDKVRWRRLAGWFASTGVLAAVLMAVMSLISPYLLSAAADFLKSLGGR